MTYYFHYNRMRYSFTTAEAACAFRQGLHAAIKNDAVYDFLLNDAQYDNAQPSGVKKIIKLP